MQRLIYIFRDYTSNRWVIEVEGEYYGDYLWLSMAQTKAHDLKDSCNGSATIQINTH
jgi:hypothetical protein